MTSSPHLEDFHFLIVSPFLSWAQARVGEFDRSPTVDKWKKIQGFQVSEESSSKVDQILYRAMIGSLLYLIASRPNILFSVCLCARFQSDPRESHLTIVKKIFRYMKGTTNLGILYKKSQYYKLVGLCDGDYVGDKIERKSTSGNCQFLSENLYPGQVKDKILLYCPQQKQNTSQRKVVAHNYSG